MASDFENDVQDDAGQDDSGGSQSTLDTVRAAVKAQKDQIRENSRAEASELDEPDRRKPDRTKMTVEDAVAKQRRERGDPAPWRSGYGSDGERKAACTSAKRKLSRTEQA
jgi:hypothetical protein